MNIDVIMCTWNSNKPYFTRCLNSIKSEIPVHHFILIDRFSNDGTVEAVRKAFPNAIVVQTNQRLGMARKRGIELVDTEFFVFVDSDIELCKAWFKYVMKHLDSLTGAVQGPMLHMFTPIKKWVMWSRNVRKRFETEFRENIFPATLKNPDVARGSTHGTLIRTRLVKDWDPPKDIPVFEDHLLLRHVVRKGYVWKIISKPIAKHYGILSLKEWIGKARWQMAGARLIGYNEYSFWFLLKALPRGIINAFFASLRTGEPVLLPYRTLVWLAYIQGWVACGKYLELER